MNEPREQVVLPTTSAAWAALRVSAATIAARAMAGTDAHGNDLDRNLARVTLKVEKYLVTGDFT